MVKKKGDNKTRDSQLRVITNWQYTEQPNPAFQQLMALLLKSKEEESSGKTTT